MPFDVPQSDTNDPVRSEYFMNVSMNVHANTFSKLFTVNVAMV